MPQRLRVFISSPGDVPDERLRADLVIDKLAQDYGRFFALESYRWEHEPMLASGHFQDAIDPPSQFDIVVLILWSRLGTPLPRKSAAREYTGIDGRAPVTGTEWEYEEALKAAREHGAPDMLAFRNVSPAAVDLRDVQAREHSFAQFEALDAFWKRHFADRGVFLAAFDEYRTLEDFAQRLEASLRKLIEKRIASHTARPAADTTPIWSGAPFRGLAAYELAHAPIFFGRDAVVTKAAEQLAAQARGGSAFLLMSGPSGSGKSSVVKAALVPRLMKPQRISGAAFLRRAVFRPGDGGVDVILGLVEALTRETAEDGAGLPELVAPGQDAKQLAAHLRGAVEEPGYVFSGALGRLTEAGRKSGRVLAYEEAKLILVVDQLEELFTLPGIAAGDRALFVRLLAGLARSGAVWVIATLRSDFWHRAAEIPEMIILAQGQGRIDIAAPSPAELAEMIRKPAGAAGLAFEVQPETGIGLDSLLAERAAAEPGVLPLLSFTLDELYRHDIVGGDSRVLSYATYEALGGLEGAIATRAEERVASLPPTAQAALPRVLRTLATVSTGSEPVSVARAAPIDSFPAGSDARAVVDAMTAARLLVASSEGATPTVRLAHEALLSRWTRARDQLARDGRDLAIRELVERQCARWRNASGQVQRQLLLRDPDLANAVDLDRRWGDELDPGVRGFVESSRRRARLRQQAMAVAMVVFALTAVGAAGAAWMAARSERVATRSFNLAVEQADALVSKISYELKDISGVSKDAIRRILIMIEQEFNEIAKIDAANPRLLLSRATMLSAFVDNYADLGDVAEAARRAHECVGIVRPLLHDDPGNIDMIRGLGSCLEKLGDALHARTASDDAGAAYRESIALRRRALARDVTSPMARLELAHVLNYFSYHLVSLGKNDEALAAAQEGLAMSQSLVAIDPGDARWQREYVESLNFQAMILEAKGSPGEALPGYEKARDIIQSLFANDKGNATLQRYLSNILANIGLGLIKLNRHDEAESSLQQSLDLKQRLVAIDPDNTTWQYEYSIALFYLGYDQHLKGKGDAARASLQTMRDALHALIARDPENALWRSQLVFGLWWLAVASADKGDMAAARAGAQEALVHLQTLDTGKLDSATQARMKDLQDKLSTFLRPAKID